MSTISQILVTNTGKDIQKNQFKIVDSVNRNVINSGILEPIFNRSAIVLIDIDSQPKGLPDDSVEIFVTNNTNGVIIISVESSNSASLHKISTPTNTV